MKKEELIKRLDRVKLPELRVAGHRAKLKQVLMEGTVVKGVTVARNRQSISGEGFWPFLRWLKGPVWHPALASIVSVIVLAVIIAGVFYIVEPSPAVIAADVVKKDPAIQQKLNGAGEIFIVRIEIEDRIARVVCGRGMGDFIEADVDISDRTVVTTRHFEGLFLSELTPEANESSINIALLDDRVKPLLSKGATVGKVFPVFSGISSAVIVDGNLVKITPAACNSIVPLYINGKAWLVEVNLEENSVTRIIEPQTMFMPYFHEILTASSYI